LENQRIGSEERQLLWLLKGHKFRKLNKIHPTILVSVESTQTFLQTKIGSTEEGDLVISKIQTGGKGREGRSWISDEGGLWMTLILKPPLPQILGGLPLVATYSIVKTIEEFGLSGCSVKLPNDVYFSRKKIAGVLVDAAVQGDESIAFLGIGINVNNDPSKNQSLSGIATSLYAEKRRMIDLNDFTFRLLVNIDGLYDDDILKQK
jgi:BirA family biotin operon repressor/biotin-[acetyl-CoA-carboxylase] ligase